MKRLSIYEIGLALVVFGMVLSGCIANPSEAIQAADQAIQEARLAGAEIYAPEALNQATSKYAKAMEEVQIQEKEFVLWRTYENAQELLAQAKFEAQQAQTLAGTNKLKAKSDAEAAIISTKKTLEDVKITLAQAPTGKGTQADLQALRADLQVAESMLSELEAEMNKEAYLEATTKAQAIQAMAAKVQDHVAHAKQKMGRAKS